MTSWTEDDAATFRAIAAVAVPRRQDMIAALVSAAPFGAGDELNILDLGSGEGLLAEALLTHFPRAELTALDGSESMRREISARLARFGARARVAAFDVAALDWWDAMFGVDLVVSSLCLHHLNDAKKQYLYKAVADRLSPRGLFLIADRLERQQLLHHLVWLKHAGFPVVDCFWLRDRHAIFGGLTQTAASAPPPLAGSST